GMTRNGGDLKGVLEASPAMAATRKAKTGEALFEIVNMKEQWKYMLQHMIQLEKDLWESVVRSVELHKTGQASGSRSDLFEDEDGTTGGTVSRVNSLSTMFRETFSDITAKW
ncbi:hypothetical protein CYMTET_41594, partial [Cymbomonas tetramitiformis]